MKSFLNLFFARTHSLAFAVVLALQVMVTTLTGKVLIPLLAAVVACVFISFLEEVNIEVQKRSK